MTQSKSAPARIAVEDLRLLLAIAEDGSLGGAAKRLGLDHSSAFRRLGALERRLSTRLFERKRDGYAPTPAGEAAIVTAERVCAEFDALDRQLAGTDLRLEGRIRVTTTDTLLPLLAPIFATLRALHPGIVVELALANAFFTLTRRDADLAIRPAATAPEHLVARRVATVATALYAAPGYWSQHRKHDLAEHDWIAPDDSLSHLGSARWLAAHVAPERIVHRADSLLALQAAAIAGLGVAPLPCFLGDREPALQRVGEPLPEAAVPLWLITHPDLRRVRRIGTVIEFLAEQLHAQQALFEGGMARDQRRGRKEEIVG
jgi:molybdate transport repressor ModE-like protein